MYRPDDNRPQPADPAENRAADGLARPLSSEESRCPCGAHAEAAELCAKCRARAAWARRRAPRERPKPEAGPRRRRRCGTRGVEPHRPESDPPHQRRSSGRRPGR
jgi:hypothetical protein